MNVLLARAKALAAKVNHNPIKLEEIITAGLVPVGATVAWTGTMAVVYTGSSLDQINSAGIVVKSVPLSTQEWRDNALVQYAVHASRT